MNVAKLLITKIVDEQKLRPALQAGLTKGWLKDQISRVVFDGEDLVVYRMILDHYDQWQQVPDRDQIHLNYPNYEFEKTDRSYAWLVFRVGELYRYGIVDDFAGELVELYDDDQIDEAIALTKGMISKIDKGIQTKIKEISLGDKVTDYLDRYAEPREPGIPLGIESIDENFGGMQPGQLITILGRNKGAKTWLLTRAAMMAWEHGCTGTFFSVELNEDQIEERMIALEARVSYVRLRERNLRPSEYRRVEDAVKKIMSDEIPIAINRDAVALTIDDVRAAIERNNPHIVFIDGFYFMHDTETKKSAMNWEAHESLAAKLKLLAEQTGVVIVTTTQAQEKQYNEKSGVEGRTMAGGTGLLKASDLVLGIDKPDQSSVQKITMIANRENEPITAYLEWNWDEMIATETSGPGEDSPEGWGGFEGV